MKRSLFVTSLALVWACTALPASAGENDFIGYEYSQNYQRDYDRGFFFGAEGWLVNPRNLGFEPALATSGTTGAIGGRLMDVDFDYDEISPRVYLGFQASRRVGRFTLSYWDFNDDASRSELGTGLYSATGTHPARGNVSTDSFTAEADIDTELARFEWRKDLGVGNRFAGYWSAGVHWWEMEYGTESRHFNGADAGNAVRVTDFTSTKGVGGFIGFGGDFYFNERFSIGARGALGWASAEQDYTYVDENTGTGSIVGFIEREDTELSSMTFEGELAFNVRVSGGFDIGWGYRYMNFEDVIAEDRFVDNTGKFVSVENAHDLAFEGPYVNFRWVTGLAKIDSDGDGVMDVYDDCPDTPAGAWVNEAGCPRDLDEDGVYDGIDRCPGTQFGTRVDEWGCGVDSDGDGVADGLDLCPNTPDCAIVDPRGCPKDSDADGVANGCDACPGTAGGATVDGMGCVTDGDSDGDGVPDSRDRCPNTRRGASVDSSGCEIVVRMQINFGSDADRFSSYDAERLNRIATFLTQDGGRFEVAGHTDSQNTVEYNQGLSERRARAVMEYLVSRGVPGNLLTSVGYSEIQPIADNSTAEGRSANRRVEVLRR